MSLNNFIQAHIDNLQRGAETLYFRSLMAALDETYRDAIRAMPAEGVPTIFGKFLLICDKSMRSAAMLITARQPEDSVAITRRAIETAQTALAIKLNDANAMNWLSGAERMERWAARESNEKPAFFKAKLEDVRRDPLMDELGKFLGVLSDAYVHFTPEFYSTLAWETRINTNGVGGQIFLNYFHTDDREVGRHYNLLAAVHGLILKAFDRCVDGRLAGNSEYAPSLARFQMTRKVMMCEYQRKYLEPAVPEAEATKDDAHL